MPFLGADGPGSQRGANMTNGLDRAFSLAALVGTDLLGPLTSLGLARQSLIINQTSGDLVQVIVEVLQKREWRRVDVFTVTALNVPETHNYTVTCRQWRVSLANPGAGPGPAVGYVLMSSIGAGT